MRLSTRGHPLSLTNMVFPHLSFQPPTSPLPVAPSHPYSQRLPPPQLFGPLIPSHPNYPLPGTSPCKRWSLRITPPHPAHHFPKLPPCLYQSYLLIPTLFLFLQRPLPLQFLGSHFASHPNQPFPQILSSNHRRCIICKLSNHAFVHS